jgi:hypothetical protein
MPYINLFFFVLSALKNIKVTMAMLQFFALLKQKITKVSNTAFCKPIGINGEELYRTNELGKANERECKFIVCTPTHFVNRMFS